MEAGEGRAGRTKWTEQGDLGIREKFGGAFIIVGGDDKARFWKGAWSRHCCLRFIAFGAGVWWAEWEWRYKNVFYYRRDSWPRLRVRLLMRNLVGRASNDDL